MNTRAIYKDQSVVDTISTWWAERNGNGTVEGHGALDIYSDYVTHIVNGADFLSLSTMPNYSQFVKCLLMARVIEFAPGMWQLVPGYEPSVDKVRRVAPRA